MLVFSYIYIYILFQDVMLFTVFFILQAHPLIMVLGFIIVAGEGMHEYLDIYIYIYGRTYECFI